jgi:DNA-binding NarL/FixJ family response regulator
VDTLREQLGTSVEGWERPAYGRYLAAVRAALAPEDFARAWSDGGTLPLNAIVAEALNGIGPAEPKVTPLAAPDPVAEVGLTAREGDVLRLLATGLPDREIGEALSISTRTVNGHVTNLLAKLGVDSRAAAAAFAVRHGLA